MKFKVNYIDGQDNVFKSFYTEAVHARACLDELYLKRGNFGHKVISILCPEEGLLYEFGNNQAVNRAVLEPAEALKLYGNGPKITLPEPVPSEITGELFAKELYARLKNYASNHGTNSTLEDVFQILYATKQYFRKEGPDETVGRS